MFLNHYQLQEQPFGVTPDPRYTYFTSTHREALASLAYGVEIGSGFAVMVAKPGMGKTTLLFRLLDYLQDKARTVFVFHTQCNSVDLMRYILADMKIKYSGKDLVEMHALLNQALLNEARLGRTVVVAIDESQNLSHEVLETIRLLSDFETPRRKLLQIILCGQPQLGHKLAHPDLVQLRQRITVLCRLSPLSLQEVNGYINHRLQVAGYPGSNLFTPEAVQLIFSESRGIPRVINTVCSGALSIGCALGRLRVDPEVVREVLADLSVDSLIEEMAAEQPAPVELSNDLIPPPPAPPSAYLHDAPLTQALVAALSLPPVRPSAAEREEIAKLRAKDNAFEHIAAPSRPSTEIPVPAPAAASAVASVAPALPAPGTASASPNPDPPNVPETAAIVPAANQFQLADLWKLINQIVKSKGGWVAGSVFLGALFILGLTLRFAVPGTKAGGGPSIAPGAASATSLSALPAVPASPAPSPEKNKPAPKNQHPAKKSSTAADPIVHVVQDNETLSGISVQYLGRYDDKFLDQIKKDNSSLKNPDFIRVGQKVLLPPDPGDQENPDKKAGGSAEGKP
jgi:type II secretory pathway predicted ATPase ExeA